MLNKVKTEKYYTKMKENLHDNNKILNYSRQTGKITIINELKGELNVK